MKILFATSEAAPYAKSGGLGDVAGALPSELNKIKDNEVCIVMPYYGTIKNNPEIGAEYVTGFYMPLAWRGTYVGVFKKVIKSKGVGKNKRADLTYYFIDNEYYFCRNTNPYGYVDDGERFAFFSKAVLEFLNHVDFAPDIIHCNDWQTGPLCVYLKEIYGHMMPYSKIKTLYTIHNLQYQGRFAPSTLDMMGLPGWIWNNVEFYDSVSFMKMGLVYCDYISTVSETYAYEIQTPEYGYGMEGILRSRANRLKGIVNGIDFVANNPATDKHIVKHFDAEHPEGKAENKRALQERLGLEQRDVPVIGMITRLADQKGIDIFAHVVDEMMRRDVQFVLLGTGEASYEYLFRAMEASYPGRVSANIFFDESLAQQIYASSDLFLMPSKFEPCGLGQMFSLRFGTVPIVRKTGGLADTIQHYDPETKEGNGFVFENYDSWGLMWAIDEALKTYHMGKEEWIHVVKNAMNSDYSWESSADKYIALYEQLKNE